MQISRRSEGHKESADLLRTFGILAVGIGDLAASGLIHSYSYWMTILMFSSGTKVSLLNVQGVLFSRLVISRSFSRVTVLLPGFERPLYPTTCYYRMTVLLVCLSNHHVSESPAILNSFLKFKCGSAPTATPRVKPLAQYILPRKPHTLRLSHSYFRR